jgi:hypothetical protein
MYLGHGVYDRGCHLAALENPTYSFKAQDPNQKPSRMGVRWFTSSFCSSHQIQKSIHNKKRFGDEKLTKKKRNQTWERFLVVLVCLGSLSCVVDMATRATAATILMLMVAAARLPTNRGLQEAKTMGPHSLANAKNSFLIFSQQKKTRFLATNKIAANVVTVTLHSFCRSSGFELFCSVGGIQNDPPPPSTHSCTERASRTRPFSAFSESPSFFSSSSRLAPLGLDSASGEAPAAIGGGNMTSQANKKRTSNKNNIKTNKSLSWGLGIPAIGSGLMRSEFCTKDLPGEPIIS